MDFNLNGISQKEWERLHSSGVMVVEDDESLGGLYKVWLDKLIRLRGIGEYVLCADAEEALMTVKLWLLNSELIILSDLEMPNKDGIQFAQEVQALWKSAVMTDETDIVMPRFLIATGAFDLEGVRKCWEAAFPGTKGDDYVISKDNNVIGVGLVTTLVRALPLPRSSTVGTTEES